MMMLPRRSYELLLEMGFYDPCQPFAFLDFIRRTNSRPQLRRTP